MLRAIILAAGKGSRLGELTKNISKGMLKLFGKTLIERQIEIYQKCGIDDITIVTGYKSEMINFSGINYVKNQNYATTNINESLFCASEKLSDSVIISYTDIVFEQKMIEQMLQFSGDIGVAVSLNWKKNYDGRTLHPLSEAENVLIENDKIIQIKKNISEASSDQKIGEFLGVMKLSNEGGKILLQKYLELKENHTETFHMAKSFKDAYITDMLQEIIDSGCDVSPVIVDGNWYEIDTPQDLEEVERSSMFN